LTTACINAANANFDVIQSLSAMDQRAAALCVFSMCQDVDNHAVIFKDNTVMNSIIKFLKSDDVEVVSRGLKVCLISAQHLLELSLSTYVSFICSL
jgi:hypothetical protein